MSNAIFYRGPSLLTGDPILALAGGSGTVFNKSGTPNTKTGAVIQTYVLRSDMSPIEAVNTGADAAICGDCKLRGDGGGAARTCYVQWWRSAHQIYKALDSAVEMTPDAVSHLIAGEHVRICAYGDPTAIPMAAWLTLLREAAGWTGYTHQWRAPQHQAYRSFLMASVDSAAEQREAAALGWRTFRVRGYEEPLGAEEIICPASEEAGKATTCERCGLCKGLARPAKSIAIYVHGTRVKWFPSTQRAALEAGALAAGVP